MILLISSFGDSLQRLYKKWCKTKRSNSTRTCRGVTLPQSVEADACINPNYRKRHWKKFIEKAFKLSTNSNAPECVNRETSNLSFVVIKSRLSESRSHSTWMPRIQQKDQWSDSRSKPKLRQNMILTVGQKTAVKLSFIRTN